MQCALMPIYPSSGTKRLFCGRQLNILQDVFFEGRGTMSKTLSQRRMTNRSDRVDDVVLTGQHLPADWHLRCESNVKELSQERTFAEVFVQCLGSQMERHEGCSLKMHASGKKKVSIR